MTIDTENLRRERAALDIAFKAINERYGAGERLDHSTIKAFFAECLSAARLYPDAASMYASAGIYRLLGKASSAPLVINDPAKNALAGMFGTKAKFANAPHLKATIAFVLVQNIPISEAEVIAVFTYYVAAYGAGPPPGLTAYEYQSMATTAAWMAR